MKILIVGAGPIGCYTAQLLTGMGYHPVLLEEHHQVGRPVKCAGIVGKQVFEKTRIPPSRESIINVIHGAFIACQGENFTIQRPSVAYIINREQFDLNMSQGLEIHLKQKVKSIEKSNNTYLVRTKEGEEWEADILIGADGPDSVVRDFLLRHILDNQRSERGILSYYGVQYRLDVKNWKEKIDSRMVQVYFYQGIPFFLWMIPEDDRTIRLGIIGKNGRKMLDSFIAERQIDAEMIDRITGKIALGLIPVYGENIALVGDAACQVKPLTGGGIFYGLQSAEILADCIGRQRLSEYDKRYREKFGTEIRFGMKARKFFEGLDSDELNELFRILQKNARLIENLADFENHFILFKELAKRPAIFMDAGKILSYFIKDLMKQ